MAANVSNMDKLLTADNSDKKTVGEIAAAQLPVGSVALYTTLNTIIQENTTSNADTLDIARWILWGVMLAVTIFIVLRNERKPGEKFDILRVVLTILTFAVWSATLGGVFLDTISDWDNLWGPLALGFFSGVVPLIQAQQTK